MGLSAVCDCGISLSYSLTIFAAGDSTVNQLLDIYNAFSKALDDVLEVKAFFVIYVRRSIVSGTKAYY